jgi:hypothetical protein
MKKKVTKSDELEAAIAELELKAAAQKMDIQETFTAVSENLKPLNLVKSGVRSVFSGEHKEDILNALIGLGSGFLSRRLILGKSNGIIGKTVGKAIQWGMAGLVSKNAEKIKEKAGELIDRFFRKNKRPSQTPASHVEGIELKAQSRR